MLVEVTDLRAQLSAERERKPILALQVATNGWEV